MFIDEFRFISLYDPVRSSRARRQKTLTIASFFQIIARKYLIVRKCTQMYVNI